MSTGRMCAVVLAAVVLFGCGGGGGGDGGSGSRRHTLSLSPSAVQLSVTEGQYPQSASVTVTFSGAGVVAGTLPNESLPPWLSVSAPPQSSSPATVTITAAPASGVAFGTHAATLRFATGDADQSNVTLVDLPVTLTYHEAFRLGNAGELHFSRILGSPPTVNPVAARLQVRGGSIRWDVVQPPGWLDVTPSSGTAAATAVVTTVASMPPGDYAHQLQFREHNLGISLFLPVTYTVRAAQLEVDRSVLDFEIGPDSTATALSQQLVLSDDAQSAPGTDLEWQASTNADWLQLSANFGRTSPAATLVASVDRARLETLAPGYRNPTITITARDRVGVWRTREIPVNFNLNLPLVRAANPYLVAPGTNATTRIRGEGMREEDFTRLRVGTQSPLNIRREVNLDSELLFDVTATGSGALSAGRHLVRFDNALGLTRSSAEVLIQNPVSAGPGSMASSGRLRRLIYDPQRGRLYTSSIVSQTEVQRFQWDAGSSSWVALSTVPVGNGLNDMDIDRGGRRLIIASQQAVQSISLDDAAPATRVLTMVDSGDCQIQPWQLRILSDDEALISQVNLVSTPACDAQTLARYDLVRNEFLAASLQTYSRAAIAPTHNRRRAFVGPDSRPFSVPVLFYESLTHYESWPDFGGLPPLRPGLLEANNNRNHLLINSTELWDLDGPRRRNIAQNRLTRLSPDGLRAYSYVHSTTQSRRINVYDIDWAAYPAFPLLTTLLINTDLGDIPIDNPDPRDEISVAMDLSPDGRLLFISGLSAIEVLSTP